MSKFANIFVFVILSSLCHVIIVGEHFYSLVKLAECMQNVKKSKLEVVLSQHIAKHERVLLDIERKAARLGEEYCNGADAGAGESEVVSLVTQRHLLNQTMVLTKTSRYLLDEIATLEQERLPQDIWDEISYDHPQPLDLKSFAGGIYRLTATYNNTMKDVSKGKMFTTQGMPLTAQEFEELGLILFSYDRHYDAMNVLIEIMKMLPKFKLPGAQKATVLHKYATTAAEHGNYKDATNIAGILYNRAPCRRYRLLKSQLQRQYDRFIDTASQEDIKVMEGLSKFKKKPGIVKTFNSLCSNDGRETPVPQKRLLVCRYTNLNNPLFMIKPLKEEEMLLEPFFALYHHVFPKSYIEEVKANSTEKLERALIPCKYGMCPSTRRVCGEAKVNAHHPVLTKMSNTLAEITNTNVLSFESTVHVLNYGIGGHFRLHFDFHPQATGESDFRISSSIVYLSELEDGGGPTVFPNARLRVQPELGSVMYWHNLYRNTTTNNELSLHAGCPVVSGSKWIAVFLMRSKNNEFKRPCTLNQLE